MRNVVYIYVFLQIILGGNEISDADIIAITKGCEEVTNFSQIDLGEFIVNIGCNDIGDIGAKAIVKILKHNPDFTSLNLSKKWNTFR